MSAPNTYWLQHDPIRLLFYIIIIIYRVRHVNIFSFISIILWEVT